MYCDVKELLNGYKFQYSFMDDFDKIDTDINEIKKLFNELYNENKNDIKKITELACVVNIRSWFWYDYGNSKLSKLYSDFYYKIYHYIYEYAYDNKIFDDTDTAYFYSITD